MSGGLQVERKARTANNAAALGKQGRVVPVMTNCFEVTRRPEGYIQHYDVDFSVATIEKRLYVKWLLREKQVLGPAGMHGVYDGAKNLYVASNEKNLNKEPHEIDEWAALGGPSPGRKPEHLGKPITCKFQHAASINMMELWQHVQGRAAPSPEISTCIAALNVAMKNPAANAMPSNRNIICPIPGPGQKLELGAGLHVWRAFFTSIRPGIGRAFLCFDPAVGLMREPGTLIPILKKIANASNERQLDWTDRSMPPGVRVQLKRFLMGLVVTIKIRDPKIKFKIKGIADKPASKHMFEREPGQEMSVAQYLEQKYQRKLVFPHLPCVAISKTGFYPLEMMDVVLGGSFYAKLNPKNGGDAKLVADICKFATLAPKQKLTMIREGMKYLQRQSPMHVAWNLDIADEPLTVSGRQLQPPTLLYSAPIQPRDGQWNVGKLKAKKSAAPVDRWIVVAFADDNDRGLPIGAVRNAVTSFVQACEGFGITFRNKQPIIFHAGGNPNVNVRQAFIDASKRANYGPASPPQLVVTFTNRQNSRQYAAIKQTGDLMLGVTTQNMSIQKIRNAKPTYFQNVALKVNVKLGGVNQEIQGGPPMFAQKPTIVFGADVSHPAPGAFQCKPSVAAVVSSINLAATEWTAEVRLQTTRQEMIQDMEEVAVKLMKKFFAATKKKPERVIFFRDGVSEGQFDDVVRREAGAIKRACAALSISPTITFIVCSKRHRIRMFPNSEENADRSGNCRAGTVIDTVVVHPYIQDYYLLSHGGLLGTSKPCHYSVVLDEAKMTPDVIQSLCFYLTHLYPRSTRSVSIPAPAYFAHHVAYRTAQHMGDDEDDAASSVGSGVKITKDNLDEQREQALQKAKANLKAVHNNVIDKMYYM